MTSLSNPLERGDARDVNATQVRFFDLVRPTVVLDGLPARRKLELAGLAFGLTLALGALWGAAAGSKLASLAAQNLIKVPAVVIVAALSALPFAIVASKLLGDGVRATDILLAYARSMLVGGLMLATSIPIVALYYHSSKAIGPVFASATVLLALVSNGVALWQLVKRLCNKMHRYARMGLPIALCVMQSAALLQAVSLVGPFLPDETRFRRGADGLFVEKAREQREHHDKSSAGRSVAPRRAADNGH